MRLLLLLLLLSILLLRLLWLLLNVNFTCEGVGGDDGGVFPAVIRHYVSRHIGSVDATERTQQKTQ